MYEDDDTNEEGTPDRPQDPARRAQEKSDEFRIHAQLAAVFEGPRKFDASVRDLDPDLAREIQRTVGRLEKSKSPDSPILPQPSAADATTLLNLPTTKNLPTNDYHVSRRPGEVLIVRWLAGDEVDTFYTRLQAHFDAALEGFREEEKQQQEWKQDPKTLAFLKAMDSLDVKMADRYLRNEIRTHNLFVLSTQTADELDILYLCDYIMSVDPATLVGRASAPPDESPTERDRAWFFKLFSLRGIVEGAERMCFFTYLQKAEDTFDSDW